MGEATGARPRTGPTVNQSRQILRENLENEAFKEELRKRNVQKNERKIASSESKEKAEKAVLKMESLWEEITAGLEEKMRVIHVRIRKEAKSAKRAAQHQKSDIFGGLFELQRDRQKLKIPPMDDEGSSETFYTSSSDSDDSIPTIEEPEWGN